MNQKKSKHKPFDRKNSDSPNIDSPSDPIREVPLAKWKVTAFKFILTFGFPLLFLVLPELCLALAGIGTPTGFYVSSKQNGEQVFLSNQYFMRPYFGAHVSRGSLPFSIPKEKPEDTVRIFLLGASVLRKEIPTPLTG